MCDSVLLGRVGKAEEAAEEEQSGHCDHMEETQCRREVAERGTST